MPAADNCQAAIPNLTGEIVATDNVTTAPALTITQTPAAGTLIGSGGATVTITVKDAAGNASTCSAIITVLDQTPPRIVSFPANKLLSANASCRAAIPNLIGEVIATDNCTATSALTITQSPEAGTAIGLGSTSVTIAVTDAAGNTSSGTTKVTIVDTAPPTVSAALAPIGKVENKEGRFSVGFSATDNCDPAPATLPVMEIPGGMAAFPAVFEKEDDDDEAKITFDLEKRRIILEGSDETALRALLAQALTNNGVAVRLDQQLRLHLEEKQRFEFIFSNGALIRVKAPTLVLRVTARDASGNVATARVVASFAVK